MDILFAQTAPVSGNSFLQWLPFILMFLIIYLFMIRPQFKQQKEKKLMLDNLKKGDRVITSGGIYGTIAGFKEKDNVLVLTVDKNVDIQVSKSAVQTIARKGEGI
tara:strand:+ start:117 stop:431 length:315 start_codon:yes stop_codon:yes gene_type:complete